MATRILQPSIRLRTLMPGLREFNKRSIHCPWPGWGCTCSPGRRFGGMLSILSRGTVGGMPMNVAFMGCGLIFDTGVGLGGVQPNFQGPLDLVLNDLFWVPNLVVTELVIRGQGRHAPTCLSAMAAAVIAATTMLIAGATYCAARDFWLPLTLALFRGG